jgi:hypothetical protein
MNRIYSESNVEITIPVSILSKLVELQFEIDDLVETAALSAPMTASLLMTEARIIDRKMVEFLGMNKDAGFVPSHVSVSDLNLRLIPALAC